MRKHLSLSSDRLHASRTWERSGIALVVVLGALLLMSGLVVAFFTSVTTERGAAQSYANSTNVRALADSALNTVIAQVRDGTSGLQDPSSPTSQRVAWASQPGLIRTFSQSGQVAAYKLYSAATMIGNGVFAPADDLAPGLLSGGADSWDKMPDVFTDLNSPVMVPDGAGYLPNFPILDGSNLRADPGNTGSLIIDVDKNGTPDVEGFSVQSPQTYDPAKSISSDNNPVPFPVRWLYTLQDGSIIAPDNDGKVAGASRANPITGRIAFWTDDETSKVNINTASEGTFWSTPVGNTYPRPAAQSSGSYVPTMGDTLYEVDLSAYQGANQEYQRYPGHPAMVSLSPILFAPLARAASVGSNPLDPNDPANRPRLLQMVYDLIPRVNYGVGTDGRQLSSQGGTVRYSNLSQTSKLGPDGQRLYANLDELLYDPNRTVQEIDGDRNNSGDPLDDRKAIIEQSKFFLTAQSRSPEVNLFNKPRVALWPITLGSANESVLTSTKASAFDKTIAFCATIPGTTGTSQSLIFARYNPNSSSADWIAGNLDLYNYLSSLTNTPIPGFGGTFANKYASDNPQILTEIFDYIRAINLADSTDRTNSNPPTYPYAYTEPNASLNTDANSAQGQVLPIVHPTNGTRGLGRMSMISEFGIVMSAKPRNPKEVNGAATSYSATNDYPDFKLEKGKWKHSPNENSTLVEVVILAELFSPMAGFSPLSNNFRLTYSNLNVTLDGQPVVFKDKSGNQTSTIQQYTRAPAGAGTGSYAEGNMGGSQGVLSLMADRDPTTKDPLSPPPIGAVTVSKGSQKNPRASMVLSGSFSVTIEAPYQLASQPVSSPSLVQSFNVTIAPQAVPVPQQDLKLPDWSNVGKDKIKWPSGGSEGRGRINLVGTPDGSDIITSRDTVRSVVPLANVQGDYRLTAARSNPTEYAIQTGSQTQALVHSLRTGVRTKYSGAQFGNLVSQVTAYDSYTQNGGEARGLPDVPIGVAGVTDWDNGPGLVPDGALANKADEGTTDGVWPYLISDRSTAVISPTLFTPNKQISSAVSFGSLPTGVVRNLPWQTLLFRPVRSYLPGGLNHPGAGNPSVASSNVPADHLLLDLFWMPVVEPYPISEPFSTAGRINLNYQIAPFTHVKRDTGLRAAMKNIYITALPHSATAQLDDGPKSFPDTYKSVNVSTNDGNNGGGLGIPTRFRINLNETLRGFDARFANNQPFRSATEICDMDLVPVGQTASNVQQFWGNHLLTGDNSRENPYAHLYPLLTTKSNTYTVHLRVQSLKKIPNSDPEKFDSNRDQVISEYRGSYVIERFLDPNTQTFDMNSASSTLGPYKFRVASSKQFAP